MYTTMPSVLVTTACLGQLTGFVWDEYLGCQLAIPASDLDENAHGQTG